MAGMGMAHTTQHNTTDEMNDDATLTLVFVAFLPLRSTVQTIWLVFSLPLSFFFFILSKLSKIISLIFSTSTFNYFFPFVTLI